uniref:ShKT domain-containing protein n=1 Tax=viral metagenome TaxID=1070528 RepID=A0A6C0EDG1_9ZZZZ
MSYNIFGEYTINEHMSNTDSTDCVDNPYFQCPRFANTYYRCYDDSYNKYKKCCATCKTMSCVDSDVNCQALVEAGKCNSNNHEEKENTWNKCCSSCNLISNQNPVYSNT